MRILAGLSLVLALALPAQAQEGAAPSGALQTTAVPEVLRKAVDDVIRPGYRAFAMSAKDLASATRALCDAPSAETLAATKSAFDATVERWSEIEIVRIGPVIERNRFEHVLFYPDRKGTGLRQVQAVLAKPDESVTSPEGLKGKSVAMQGLGALEFVLYGTGADVLSTEKRGFRCRYGAAIAANIEATADELSAEWDKLDGVQQDWKAPGQKNPVFADEAEAITALLGIVVHAAEAVRDQRVESFYKGIRDGKPDNGRPKSAIYWRSGNTLPSIHANLVGIARLWETADMKTLVEPGFQSVAGSVDFVLKALLRVTAQMAQPVDRLLADEDGRRKLDFVLLNSRDLIQRMSNDYGGAIGLGAGFSFADGD